MAMRYQRPGEILRLAGDRKDSANGKTDITVPTIEKTYLGTFDMAGIITWKLKQIE
jgi:hypothetical protein